MTSPSLANRCRRACATCVALAMASCSPAVQEMGTSSAGATTASGSGGAGGATASTAASSSTSSSSSASSTSASSSSSSTSSSSSGIAAITGVTSGCGVGGKVGWSYVLPAPQNAGTPSFQLAELAAGPLGDVAVSTAVRSATGATATSVVIAPSGVAKPGPSAMAAGVSYAAVSPLAFDRQDNVLYGYVLVSNGDGGTAPTEETRGFVAGPVSKSFMKPAGTGYTLHFDVMGRDAAGDLFVLATLLAAAGDPGIDFGGGLVTTPVIAEYDAAGAFVRTIASRSGTLQVGALGHLFSSTPVSGTADDGCGTVGAAATTSTVLTKRDATGVCLFSKALPATTLFAVDPAENVLLATTFAGTIDFGGGALKSVGKRDLAIAKLDASGNHVWSKSFGASGASLASIESLGATNAGGVSLAVSISGDVDFGCGAVSSTSGSLWASFDASGAVIFSRGVSLLGGGTSQIGPVVDGLGGLSFAVQMPGPSANLAGDIVVSRFAP